MLTGHFPYTHFRPSLLFLLGAPFQVIQALVPSLASEHSCSVLKNHVVVPNVWSLGLWTRGSARSPCLHLLCPWFWLPFPPSLSLWFPAAPWSLGDRPAQSGAQSQGVWLPQSWRSTWIQSRTGRNHSSSHSTPTVAEHPHCCRAPLDGVD